MIMTPIRTADAPARPDLGTLEDAAADLDTLQTFARAAEKIVGGIRDYLNMGIPFSGQPAIEQLNDLETLIAHARDSGRDASETILAFHEAEFAARRSGKS